MKYLVQLSLTPDAGNKLERQPGGPGPLVERLLERFKPEAVYMTCSERTVYLVADLEAVDVAELMIVGSEIGGAYPTFKPVIAGSEFGEIAGTAIPSAQKIVDGPRRKRGAKSARRGRRA